MQTDEPPAVVAHPRHLPDGDARAVRPPRDGLGLDALVGGQDPGSRIDDPRHRVPLKQPAPLRAARARTRQPPVDPGRANRLHAGEAVHDVACAVAVQHVVAAGGEVGGAVDRRQAASCVPAREAADGPPPDPALRPALGDRYAVLGVARDHRAVHREVELHVLGARRRYLLADRRGALADVEGLGPGRHQPPAAAVAVAPRIARIDPLDVVVDLLADVAGDQRPGVVVAPADTRPRPEPRHGEAGAVDAGRVLAELPEDRGRALAGLRRPQEQRAAASRTPAADGGAVGADPGQGQPFDDVAQCGRLALPHAGDRAERARVAHRQPPLGAVGQPLAQDRPRRRVRHAAAHRGSGRVVLEQQVVPDREATARAEALGQAPQQRGVGELARAALAGELHVREEHHDANRVRRLPGLGVVAERVEDQGPPRRVEHHLLHALVEPVAEGLELVLDGGREERVLARHVRGVVEVPPHRLVGGEHVLALELGDPSLREQPDADRQERPLLGELVAGAVGESVQGASLDVGDAMRVAVDGDLAPGPRDAAGRLCDRDAGGERRAHERSDQPGPPSAPHPSRYTGLRAQSSRSGRPKFSKAAAIRSASGGCSGSLAITSRSGTGVARLMKAVTSLIRSPRSVSTLSAKGR